MEHNPKLFPPSEIQNCTVLELGSGCGVGGMAFMLRGAEVTFTDLENVVETLTLPNANVCTLLPCIYMYVYTPYILVHRALSKLL